MTIIVQSNQPGTGGGSVCYPTAQQIINGASLDLLQRIAPEDPIMLSYINRVQLQILRASRWKFLESAPQRFVTQTDRSDYWVGPTGAGPLDCIDTGLNISNIGPIKTNTFYDRTNFNLLSRTSEQLLAARFAFRDESSRAGPPRTWRNAPDTPNIINLYPAPDNQNNFQPVPEAPACSVIPGGNLPARIYFVRTTFIDSLNNESSASNEAWIYIPANNLVVVQGPIELPSSASGIEYNRYNVYLFNAGTNLSLSTGQETLATPSPLTNTGPYIEPTTGFLTNNVSFPTANNVAQMQGYLIEFRYFAAKQQVTSLGQFLQIPCDYIDLMTAGVNWYLAKFVKDIDAAQEWKMEYDAGITGMIRDKNLFPRAPEFIHVDPTAPQRVNYYGYETNDPFYNNQY